MGFAWNVKSISWKKDNYFLHILIDICVFSRFKQKKELASMWQLQILVRYFFVQKLKNMGKKIDNNRPKAFPKEDFLFSIWGKYS